jgi:hypothetical protein
VVLPGGTSYVFAYDRAQPLASAGDSNGDGYADLAIGFANGGLEIHSGGQSGVSIAPTISIPSAEANSVANAGDVNGDGFGDVAVGPYLGGPARVFYGASGGITDASSTSIDPPRDYFDFGNPVLGGGDIDGDGYSEVLVVQSANVVGGPVPPPPTVWVYRGSATGIATAPAAQVSPPGYGPNSISKFALLATALDADGDGFWDVALGDAIDDKVWIFMGGSSGIATTPATAIDNGSDHGRFGDAMSGGDVNGDGYEDLAVGAPELPTGAGRVYLFNGSASGVTTTPSWRIDGPPSFGAWMAVTASGS